MITEADPANATVSKYDYGFDQLVRLDNRGEGRSFFHLDFLGSTVGLTDSAGASRQSIFYDAWGNERERLGASANNFTFTGHEKDVETGLVYAKARFYDSEIGRFLNQDEFLGTPETAPSLHRYLYARSNPLRFLDLDGFQSTDVQNREAERAAEAYLDSLPPQEREAALSRARSITSSEDLFRAQRLQRQVEEENKQVPGFLERAAIEAKRRTMKVITDAGELLDSIYDPPSKWVGEKGGETASDILRPGEHGPLTQSEIDLRTVAELEKIDPTVLGSERLRETKDGLKETGVEGTEILATEGTRLGLETVTFKVVEAAVGTVILIGGKPFRVANYTEKSASHVFTRGHAANSKVLPGKSRFRVTEGGQKFTDEIVNHPDVKITVQENGRIRYEVDDLGRVTGAGTDGSAVRGGTVVVEGQSPKTFSIFEADEVVTQYPSGK